MSKSSTISARQTPAGDVTVATGGLVIHAQTLSLQTAERVQLVDLTERIASVVHSSGVREGLVSLWSLHTTCAVFINENQTALHADIKHFLELTVSRTGKWKHNDPEHSDCDRNNADAHLRAMLLGHSMTLQVTGGELVLGQWQRVLAAELDGPRVRSVRVHVQGVA
jgi:secondary thiamine-phosphate synthase enzyme